MKTKAYIYGVDTLDGKETWALPHLVNRLGWLTRISVLQKSLSIDIRGSS